MNKKSNKDSVVAFGGAGWFHIIYMLLMFWFYVGMINDGSNNIAGNIAEAMGTTAGNISNCNAIAGVLGVIIFLIVGVVNRKIGARMMSGINCIIAGITYMGVLNAPNTVVYTIMMAITCGTIMSAGYLCGGVLVANWFPKKKGIVMGYTTMGHNLATAAFVPLIVFLVSKLGVHKAGLPISIAVIVLGVVGLIFVRNTPFERNMYPDNVSKEVYEAEYDTDATDDGGWTTGKLLKCDQIWFVAIVTGVFQICSVGTMSQMVGRSTSLLVSFGANEATATVTAVSIMSVCAVIGVVGSFLIGVLDQKIGTKKTMQFFGIWYAAALVINVLAKGQVGLLFYLSILMIGMGIGGSANFTTSLPTSIFGRQGFDKVNSVVFPIQGFVTAWCFVVNGIVTNVIGNLSVAYIIFAVGAVIVSVCVTFVDEYKYNKDHKAELK